MLISAIATFQAINDQHRAGMAMMQTSNNILSGIRNVGAGETNFNALCQQDIKNDTDMIKAGLLYRIATARRECSEKQLKKEAKGLDYKA